MTDRDLEPVSVITSLAHRSGDSIRVVLHLPALDLQAGDAVLRCAAPGGRRFRVHANVAKAASGIHVEALIPAPRLRGAVWRLAVRSGATDAWIPVEARLLANRRQPIALLPGPSPVTRLPEPTPTVTSPTLLSRVSHLRRRVEARLRR